MLYILILLICMPSRYRWMTYGEVATARIAIGSGLVQHGIPKASMSNFYVINLLGSVSADVKVRNRIILSFQQMLWVVGRL